MTISDFIDLLLISGGEDKQYISFITWPETNMRCIFKALLNRKKYVLNFI